MDATDRLRALLAERGVEYETDDHMGFSETRWGGACAFQLAPGAGLVMAVTPEQAVEVTLGRGECRDTNEEDRDFTCSECGASMYTMIDDCWTMIGRGGLTEDVIKHPKFCPNCGRKVEA